MLKELNLQEMNEIKGGVTPEEYCETLGMLLNQGNLEWWTDDQLNSWATAYFKHCINP